MIFFLLGLMAIGGVICFVGGIMFLVAAFRVHVGWGLAVLLIPFASLVFLFTHWQDAKLPFLVQIAGAVLALAAAMSGMSIGMSAMLKGLEGQTHGLAVPAKIRIGGWKQRSDPVPAEVAPPAVQLQPKPEPEPVYAPVPKDAFVGMSLSETREMLGEPPIMAKSGGLVRYTYPHRQVELISRDGKTVTEQRQLVAPAKAPAVPPAP